MKRWILPVVALALAGVIAWPFLFGSGTLEAKGKTFTVEHRLDDEGRFAPIRDRGAIEADQAILCSWDHDRFMYFWSDGAKAGFDVAFLDAAGRVLQTGRIRPFMGRDPLDDEGLASRDEARHALFFRESTIENLGLAPGDTVTLSSDLANAKPEPMTSIQLGDKAVDVEIVESLRHRGRGLMHRPRMSEGEGMLFCYPAPRTGLNFYMRNTLMSLDIAYFDGNGGLVNVVSAERAANPATQGSGVNAPAAGEAQFVLEMPIGWFRDNGIADDGGKPVKPVSFEVSETIRTRVARAEALR